MYRINHFVLLYIIDAWVSTGGTYRGCMKLVGEAFKENTLSIDPNEKIVVLGIANWGSVKKSELLLRNRATTINYDKVHIIDMKLTMYDIL